MKNVMRSCFRRRTLLKLCPYYDTAQIQTREEISLCSFQLTSNVKRCEIDLFNPVWQYVGFFSALLTQLLLHELRISIKIGL